MTAEFKAPWSRSLILISFFATVLVLVASALAARTPDAGPAFRTLMYIAPLLVLGLSALFMVRGYELTRGSLFIRRLLWTREIPLSGLEHAHRDPRALRGSMRLFGNGGLYSFSGIFWNSSLGRFHVYATDLQRSVVLVFDHRTIVITPDDPARFLNHLALARPGAKIDVQGDAS